MKKRIRLLGLLALVIIFISTGCTYDNMDNIDIAVTSYPNEYITQYIYGEHATVTSIYPDGVDINAYKINKKLKKQYARSDLFIYNGLVEKERDLALDLLSINGDLKIIDTAYVLETDYSPEELWLNPASLLMMSQNVRLGLKEYVENELIRDEIDKNYDELKIILSELDANYRLAMDSAENKTIVVDTIALKYLEKFGLNVICINEDAKEKELAEVDNMISNGSISYIFTFEGNDLSENANNLTAKYSDLKIQKMHKLDNLSDSERSEKKDYISIMNSNLELLKQELYQ